MENSRGYACIDIDILQNIVTVSFLMKVHRFLERRFYSCLQQRSLFVLSGCLIE